MPSCDAADGSHVVRGGEAPDGVPDEGVGEGEDVAAETDRGGDSDGEEVGVWGGEVGVDGRGPVEPGGGREGGGKGWGDGGGEVFGHGGGGVVAVVAAVAVVVVELWLWRKVGCGERVRAGGL